MKKWIVLMCAAAWLASGAAYAGNPSAGKEKSKTCAACHGADGNSPNTPDTPRLAGQHADYLVKALLAYQNGTRKNAIMAPMAKPLTLRDMEDLAAFYSRQQGLATFR